MRLITSLLPENVITYKKFNTCCFPCSFIWLKKRWIYNYRNNEGRKAAIKDSFGRRKAIIMHMYCDKETFLLFFVQYSGSMRLHANCSLKYLLFITIEKVCANISFAFPVFCIPINFLNLDYTEHKRWWVHDCL